MLKADKVIELEPNNAIAFFNRGVAYYKNGNLDKALEDFNKAIKLDPYKANIYASRAVIYYLKNKLDEAIKDYNKAIELEPFFASAYFNRGLAYYRKGKFDEAIEDYNISLKLNSNDPDAYFNRGLAYDRKGKFDEAIEDFDKVLKINLNHPDAYYSRGLAYYRKDKFDEAIKDHNRTVDLNSNHPGAYYNRGLAYDRKGKFDEAIEDFDKALKINPNHSDIYYCRGFVYYQKKKFDEAIEDFDKALKINPNHANPYCGRGLTFIGKDKPDEAIEDFDKALELHPNYPDAYCGRGVAYGKKGNSDKAIKDYTKAIELDPYSPIAYYNRGSAYYMKNKLDEALVDINMAIELNPNEAVYFEMLGLVYYQRKVEIEKTICCFRVALKIYPSNANLQFKVANFYMDWETRKVVDDAFLISMGPYREICKKFYIDENAYMERKNIARAFYSKSFIELMPFMRTDLSGKRDYCILHLFIGNVSHVLDPIENKSFFFSDVRSFSDKMDSPLLHPINQTELAVQISQNNVRIRCLCEIEDDEIGKCAFLWDHYANGHKGLSYKLKIEKSWLVNNSIYINPIRYAKLPEIVMQCDSPEQVIQEGLFIKSHDYAGEKEWRMIKFGDFQDKEGITVSWELEGGFGVTIEAIYLGITMPEELKQKVVDKAKSENIPVYKMEERKGSSMRSVKL